MGCGIWGARNESNSGEKLTIVGTDVTTAIAGFDGRSTGAGGRALGMKRGGGPFGKSLSAG
jgi:hypothetical protein